MNTFITQLKKQFSIVMLLAISTSSIAANNHWKDVPNSYTSRNIQAGRVLPEKYRTVELNYEAITTLLLNNSSVRRNSASTTIELPLPYGGFESFKVEETSMMEEGLALKYPGIKTFTASSISNPGNVAKIDIGPFGFHAMVLSSEGRYFIDPINNNTKTHYTSYYRRDINTAYAQFQCGTESDEQFEEITKERLKEYYSKSLQVPIQFRTYRLALACTIEYSTASTGLPNPTKEQVLAKMVTSMNRVNGVYETDVAVTMTLIANTDTLIYLPGMTDPYTNNDGFAMLSENQTTVTNRIGNANYDIGHVFSTGGGGVASLGSVCQTSNKARGVTGSPSPIGDAFDIDYVAHEMGHQFGGNHTFNSQTGSCGGGNRASGTAYEPGSGTTIMAYAGICGADDIAPNSDPYFHAGSLDEINAFINAGGNSCAVKTTTTNNPPTANAGVDYTIPISTPFKLEGSGDDIDGDALTYSWEQMDLGPAGAPNSPSGNAPLFRFFPPKTTAVRYFPKMADIISNTQVKGERLPSYARSMKFRLTTRDNKAKAGGTGKDEMTITVTSAAGPFIVTSSSAVDTFLAGGSETITWNVANTNLSPVNCSLVRILLSTDNGANFNTILADSTANDGSEVITVPNIASTTARIKIEAIGNIFFDLNNASIRILVPSGPDYTIASVASSTTGYCKPDSATFKITINPVLGFNSAVSLSAVNLPAGSVASFSKTSILPGDSSILKISTVGVTEGSKSLTVIGNASGQIRNIPLTYTISSLVTAQAAISTPNNGQINANPNFTFTWAAVANATRYRIQIATDTNFNTIVIDTILVGSGATSYKSTNLPNYTKLFVRVAGANACGDAAYSVIVGFTTSGVPIAPSNLILVSSTATSATIRWTDNSTNENAYRVERSDNNDSTFVVIGNLSSGATQYVSNGLVAGNTYYYRVRCANSIGNSLYSNTLMVPFGVGINQIPFFDNVNIYPNPSANKFNVNLEDALLGTVQIQVVDELGRVVWSNSIVKNETVLNMEIDLENKAQGVYILKINADQKSTAKRLIKLN